MQPDANRKRQATRETVSPKPDTNGESLGEIVDRDRNDEEPDAAQRSGVGAFRVAREGMRPKRTGIAPTAVSDPAARLPRKPRVIGAKGSKR